MPVIKNIWIICFVLFFQQNNWGMLNETSNTSSLVLDSVSVLPDNMHVIIGWTLQTPVEEGFIEIHRQLDGGLYAPITTVPLTQNQFIDTGVDAQEKAYSYYVVARYPDGDNIAVSEEAHKTIYQEQGEFLVCDGLLHVNWQNYEVTTSAGDPQPLPTPFDSTKIFYSHNNQPYIQIANLPVHVSRYDLNTPHPGSYCIKIESYSSVSGHSSGSNIRCYDVNYHMEPQFLHLRKLTLHENSDHVEIWLHTDDNVINPSYVFKRHNPDDNSFIILDTVYAQDQLVQFNDYESYANERSETYSIDILDSCKAVIWEHGTIATIFLQTENQVEFQNSLQWNHYDGWENGVAEYVVLRKIANNDFQVIMRLPGQANSYTDDLSTLGDDIMSHEIQYRIKALEDSGNPFGFQDTVLSNISVLQKEQLVFIPNAINVWSQVAANRAFKPVFRFFTPSAYSMVIFNRWGQRVFQTTDYLQAWEGTSNGSESPAGTYTYIIEYEEPSGVNQKKSGVFVLMR